MSKPVVCKIAFIILIFIFTILTPFTSVLPPPSQKGDKKIIFLGVDSATWSVALPMIKMGKLPTLQALMAQGVSSKLETFKPTTSLLVWTSILTGKSYHKHGMVDWLTEDRTDLAISSNLRKCEILWTILTSKGIRSNFVGFWGSWPAEDILGNNVAFNFYFPQLKGRSQPPTLTEWIDPMIEFPLFSGFVFPDLLTRFMREGSVDFNYRALSRLYQDNLVMLTNWSEADRISAQVGMRLLLDDPGQLNAVFLRGLDLIQHIFWQTLEPKGFAVEDEDLHRFACVIPKYYRFYAELIDNYINAMDAQDSLVILSDHGMESRAKVHPSRFRDDQRVTGNMQFARKGDNNLGLVKNFGIHDEAPPGLIIFAGKPYKQHVIADPISAMDITPTLLYQLGLPVGEDMDGKAILDIFDPDFTTSHRLTTIPSYDQPKQRETTAKPISSEVDEQLKEELRSIGYIR